MEKSIFLSIVFHSIMIILTALSLPFMMRDPISLPPILSVELIQIKDTTSIPYDAKANEILEWYPKVNINDGLENTFKWILINYNTR